MFNLLLGNVGNQDTRMELHLATQETNGISLQLIQAMVTSDPSQLNPGEPMIIWEKDYNQAKADVEAKKLSGFLAFPADFTQKVEAGKTTNLEIVPRLMLPIRAWPLTDWPGALLPDIQADSRNKLRHSSDDPRREQLRRIFRKQWRKLFRMKVKRRGVPL